MAKKQRSWEKRLKGSPSEMAVNFVQSLSYDKRLYKYDIAASIAHSQMLSEQNLISKAQFRQIRNGLLRIERKFHKEDLNSTRLMKIFIWLLRRR